MFVETDRRPQGEVIVFPVLSLAGLVAWLETQPPEVTFEYLDISDCLICRYLSARGVAVRSVGGTNFTAQDGPHDLPYELNLVAQGQKTYGSALSRARELIHLDVP